MSTIPAPPQRQPIRAAAAAFVGTAIEWYDFFIYGFASALIFAKLFFSTGSEFVGMMAAFGTFAVGLLVRPLGAMVFGHLGDVIGRKRALVATLFIMGGATVGVGCLPTYEQAGVLAPCLLILMRMLQGVAVGGNWGGAVLIAAEHAPPKRRVFYASFAQLGSPAGMIMASLAFRAISSMPEEDLFSYGWRLPFLASFVLVIVGYLVRRTVSESPEFAEAQKRDDEKVKLPVKEVLTKVPRILALTIGANVLVTAGFYLTNAFLLAYSTQYANITRVVILDALFVASICQFISTPIAALIGERYGPHRILMLTTGMSILTPFLLYSVLQTRDALLITVSLSVTISFIAGCYALIAGYQASLFPVQFRYTGISMAYQFSGAIFGGVTPLIGTVLAEHYGGHWLPVAIFFAALSTISFVSLWAVRPSRAKIY